MVRAKIFYNDEMIEVMEWDGVFTRNSYKNVILALQWWLKSNPKMGEQNTAYAIIESADMTYKIQLVYYRDFFFENEFNYILIINDKMIRFTTGTDTERRRIF